MGGSTSNTSFESGSIGRKNAQKAAKIMWNMFGEGKESPFLRPFGPDVVIDGYDIGNNSSPIHLDSQLTNHDRPRGSNVQK